MAHCCLCGGFTCSRNGGNIQASMQVLRGTNLQGLSSSSSSCLWVSGNIMTPVVPLNSSDLFADGQ